MTTTQLTWTKTTDGYVSGCCRYLLARTKNRHFDVFFQQPDVRINTRQLTLASAKALAQDHAAELEADELEAAADAGLDAAAAELARPESDLAADYPTMPGDPEGDPPPADEPTNAEIRAACERVCICSPEIKAAVPVPDLTDEQLDRARLDSPPCRRCGLPVAEHGPDDLGPNDDATDAVCVRPLTTA